MDGGHGLEQAALQERSLREREAQARQQTAITESTLAIQIRAKQGDAAVRSHLAECVELLLAITLPAALGFALISGHIANVVLGPDFRELAAQTMPIIALAVVFQILTQQYLHASFLLSGRNGYYLINTATIIAANLVLSFAMVTWLGTVGEDLR